MKVDLFITSTKLLTLGTVKPTRKRKQIRYRDKESCQRKLNILLWWIWSFNNTRTTWWNLWKTKGSYSDGHLVGTCRQQRGATPRDTDKDVKGRQLRIWVLKAESPHGAVPLRLFCVQILVQIIHFKKWLYLM